MNFELQIFQDFQFVCQCLCQCRRFEDLPKILFSLTAEDLSGFKILFKIPRFQDFPDSQDLKILFSLTTEDLSDSKIFLLKIFQDFTQDFQDSRLF
jgi:hypothetical protein